MKRVAVVVFALTMFAMTGCYQMSMKCGPSTIASDNMTDIVGTRTVWCTDDGKGNQSITLYNSDLETIQIFAIAMLGAIAAGL